MAYSKTSLAAYKSNKKQKEKQKIKVLNVIKALGGKACLKQIQKSLRLPQSTISGRIGDLRAEGKISDSGFLIEFQGRKRKLFVFNKKPKSVVKKLPKKRVRKLAISTFFSHLN